MTTLVVRNDFSISKWRWLWPLALAVLIFAASGRSKIAGPSVPGGDKVAHLAVFGLLATLVLRAIRGPHATSRRQAAWLSVLLVSVYGISDEWHQHFTPGRSVEVADWLADTLGAALAVTFYSCWAKYRRWLETPVWARRERVENTAPVAIIAPP